ncbi:MAG: rSAM/selenodomain-associated transferase 1 [Paracoccaceae bacterium]|jgi:rSAM/selenodomain-associated transferase 1
MKHVVIFARRPQLGRVKTRLAADIGPVETLRFYRSTLNTVARRLSAGGGWATWICSTPDDTIDRDRLYPPGISRLPQGSGDLGQRMANCLSGFGPHPALIVGSDIPDIDRRHVAAAFDKLRRNELVFGPSDDGGYWLVGAAQGARVGNLFNDVRWSTEHALADTLENVRPGVRVAMLEPLADIDDGDAYRVWRMGR